MPAPRQVYRGAAGMRLPAQFEHPSKFGSRLSGPGRLSTASASQLRQWVLHGGLCPGRGGRVPLTRLAALGPGSGIEYGFMSTTTERTVALRYGQDWDAARGLSYVMEFALDSLNRGALLQWLSQYPGEAEVLYRGDRGWGLRGFT